MMEKSGGGATIILMERARRQNFPVRAEAVTNQEPHYRHLRYLLRSTCSTPHH